MMRHRRSRSPPHLAGNPAVAGPTEDLQALMNDYWAAYLKESADRKLSGSPPTTVSSAS